MPSFKDKKNREWELRITPPTAQKVRELHDPKFLFNDGVEVDNTYVRCDRDQLLLCNVIYVLCERQRTEMNVTEEEFWESIDGDEIARAKEALLEAIINFTQADHRVVMSAVANKQIRIFEKAGNLFKEKMEDPVLEQEIFEAMTKILDGDIHSLLTRLRSVTSSPVSSGSTQAISPTTNCF